MANSNFQLRDLSYAQYLYQSVLGALLMLALLVGIGMTCGTATHAVSARAVPVVSASPAADATASAR